MTTKPSAAPWADEPLQLIATPGKRLDTSLAHVHIASEMAQVHNVFIRGLNAIIQQAPHIPDATQKAYKEKDVKDFLFYVASLTKAIHHHHWVEESFIFPELEKLAGKQGLMDDPRSEHALFHDGNESLDHYARETKPVDWRWDGQGGMKSIIDGFTQPLAAHLAAEIELLLSLDYVDGTALRKTWLDAENIAKKNGSLEMLYDIFPTVLGCADKTFEGGNEFPPLPSVMVYAVQYWFAAGNGAWRFNPCDFWGRPRELAFRAVL